MCNAAARSHQVVDSYADHSRVVQDRIVYGCLGVTVASTSFEHDDGNNAAGNDADGDGDDDALEEC